MLILLTSGCGAAGPASVDPPGQVGQAGIGPAYDGQPVAIIMARQSNRPAMYGPYGYSYDQAAGSQWIQNRDVSEMMHAILMRELTTAGYQPILSADHPDGPDALGVQFAVTRAWTTEVMPGAWPNPTFYRAVLSAHVVVFRGQFDCLSQSYFAHGEAASGWGAFSRALDLLMRQSMPQIMNALGGCGALAQTR